MVASCAIIAILFLAVLAASDGHSACDDAVDDCSAASATDDILSAMQSTMKKRAGGVSLLALRDLKEICEAAQGQAADQKERLLFLFAKQLQTDQKQINESIAQLNTTRLISELKMQLANSSYFKSFDCDYKLKQLTDDYVSCSNQMKGLENEKRAACARSASASNYTWEIPTVLCGMHTCHFNQNASCPSFKKLSEAVETVGANLSKALERFGHFNQECIEAVDAFDDKSQECTRKGDSLEKQATKCAVLREKFETDACSYGTAKQEFCGAFASYNNSVKDVEALQQAHIALYMSLLQGNCFSSSCSLSTGSLDPAKFQLCLDHRNYSKEVGHVKYRKVDVVAMTHGLSCNETKVMFGNNTIPRVVIWHPKGRPFDFCPESVSAPSIKDGLEMVPQLLYGMARKHYVDAGRTEKPPITTTWPRGVESPSWSLASGGKVLAHGWVTDGEMNVEILEVMDIGGIRMEGEKVRDRVLSIRHRFVEVYPSHIAVVPELSA